MKVKWVHTADSTDSSTSAAVATAHGDAHTLADQPYALLSRKPVAKKCRKMQLIHEDKNCELWNFATQGHLKMKTCSQSNFEPAKEEREQLSWQSH